jgi:signal transduction histidine kinase
MSLSQYILDSREQYRLQVRERNTWLARLRWYYLIILPAITVVVSNLTGNEVVRNQEVAISAAGIGVIVNTVLWGLTKFKKQPLIYYQIIAVGQILLDVTLASGIIYLQNGLASRTTLLFAIPIVGAGLLFTRTFAYIAAAFSAIGYTTALVLYRHAHPGSYELNQVTLPAVFYGVTFFIIAIIVTAYGKRNASNEREKSYSELLALLRHQLHHPTGVIAAIVEMLEFSDNYAKWPARDKSYLQQLKRENKRQHTLVANLLESVTDKGDELTDKDKKVFNIVELLNEESISCATGAKRLADLQTRLPNKVIEVEGDAEQLGTAFDNIISNAFHYTEKGTPVIISASEENYKVTVSIHDKGEGISETEQRALFKLFSKMQSRISGDPEKLYDSGLGLYVAKLIIERHRGSLELSSSPKYGTNITVTLYKRLI